MPTYSYICQKCKNKFSVVASFEEYDKKDPKKFKCPKCGSRRMKRDYGEVFFVKGAAKSTPSIRCSCGG